MQTSLAQAIGSRRGGQEGVFLAQAAGLRVVKGRGGGRRVTDLLDEDLAEAGLAAGVVLEVELVEAVEGVLVRMHVQGVHVQVVALRAIVRVTIVTKLQVVSRLWPVHHLQHTPGPVTRPRIPSRPTVEGSQAGLPLRGSGATEYQGPSRVQSICRSPSE